LIGDGVVLAIALATLVREQASGPRFAAARLRIGRQLR
jgi:hypothetical protein